jgi:integrase
MTQSLKEQIYRTEDKYIADLEQLDRDQRILPENKAAIKRFLNNKASEGVTTIRLCIIVGALQRVGKICTKPIADFEEPDMREIVGIIERRENISQWTKNMTKTILKGMLKSMGKKPEIYEWVKNKTPPNQLRSEDLLTEEEMGKMVAATDSFMWRALLGILFECGPRPGELLNLRIKDIIRNGTKYKLYVRGKLEKTLGARVIYVYRSLPLLEQWLTIHPGNNDPESPVWITEKGKILCLETFDIVYGKISRRARITKRNWPYLARHTRLTQLYRDLGAVIGAKLAGHVLGSEEIRTYTHLSEIDVERALDAANGIQETAKPEEPLKCPKCQKHNPYGKIFCMACNAALGAAGALIHEEENKLDAKALEAFTNDPRLMALLKRLAENPGMIEKVTE